LFPLFYKNAAVLLVPKLSVIFRRLTTIGDFSECWRIANVVPVPKAVSSPIVDNYRPISNTPIISKVFECLIAIRFSSYLEKEHLLSSCQFAYGKGLGTCDALLTVSHHLQVALDRGQEARLVQLDFSSAFDRVSHVCLLSKLRSIGLSGSMLSMIEQFLCGRRQSVFLDGSYSEFVDVVSGVPQGSVLCTLLFVVCTADLFLVVKNHLVNYANDSTLFAVVGSLAVVGSPTSLTVDLACISE
jgi:hypothetical protein